MSSNTSHAHEAPDKKDEGMSEKAVTIMAEAQSDPVPMADPLVSMIERVVMSPDADLDKLERMLAMKERIDAQNARVQFESALALARAEIPPIMKDASVDFTSSKGRTHYRHETLAGIAKAIDPILSRYGLSYRFRTEQGQGGVRVTCIIAHSHGHSEETSLACAPDGSGNKNPFQAVGSAVTYLQRYTLKAALGLSAEVDDDAQGAAPRPDHHRSERQARHQPEARREPSHDDLVNRAMQSIAGAETMDALEAIWKRIAIASKETAADQRVISAKNARKAALSPALDDDEIPY